ncbi:hypothetical protein HanXRQr2_Chr08g0330441 [Helianthus annuus]|uniref:Uncharacterized protein n=1 Tax=Helianthus annuus TaxID=4232 RepID=A0A9K3ID97_HELAN|nr:hypothetical protein HanXRQr2_Chr08g0330441 [Helianthus annuus]
MHCCVARIKLLYVMHYFLFNFFLRLGFGPDEHVLFSSHLVYHAYLFGRFLVCFVFHLLHISLINASPLLFLCRTSQLTFILVVVYRRSSSCTTWCFL